MRARKIRVRRQPNLLLQGNPNMPIVTIKLAGNLTREQKKQIAAEVSDTLERVAQKPKRATYITFEDCHEKTGPWAASCWTRNKVHRYMHAT